MSRITVLGSRKRPYFAEVLRTEPIAYWPLWETEGVTAEDIAGAHNGTYRNTDGVLNGILLGQEGVGDGKVCPLFNDGFVNIYSAGLDGAFDGEEGSLMVWFKPFNAGVWSDGDWRQLISLRQDTDNRIVVIKHNVHINYIRTLYRSGGSSEEVGIYTLSNDWNCIILTWSLSAGATGEITTYLDGTQYGQIVDNLGAWVGGLESTTANVIGAGTTAVSYPWYGYIAHAAIWDKPLTAEQAKWLFRIVDKKIDWTIKAEHDIAPLVTPTYDGLGQAMHPDVYYRDSELHGYKYWMAMTPYTDTNNQTERPSILVSNNGIDWDVPPGLTNPVVDEPQKTDPDLIVDESDNMHIIYRANRVPDYDMMITSSPDGINWSTPQVIFNTLSGSGISPAVVWDGSQWLMFTATRLTDPYEIRRRTASDLYGPWSAPVTCNYYNLLPGDYPWHLDVIRSGDRLLMLLNTRAVNLVYGYSDDWGLNWIFDERPFLRPGSWATTWLYRSTFVKNPDNTLSIWYSGRAGNVWNTGLTVAEIMKPGRT